MTNNLHFRVGHVEDAENLIKNFHYSGRMAGNVQFVATWHESGGLFGDYGKAVAACTFSIPGTRWAVPVWELSRLVRTDDCRVPLSGFLAKALAVVKKKTDLVVSFADMTQSHHGGIYQACSWNFSDYREPRQDGLLVNGTFVPGRSCNSRWGTSSPTKLAERLAGQDIAPHWDAGKYLYWKATTSQGKRHAETLGLKRLPYEKPHYTQTATKPVQEVLAL